MKFYDIDGDEKIKIESTLYEIEVLRNILRMLDNKYSGLNNNFCLEEKKFIKENLKKIQKKIDIFFKLTQRL